MLANRLLRRVCATFFLCTALHVPVVAQQSRVVELNDSGWKSLERGDANRAARDFTEALSIRPNDPVLLTGSAAAANALGNLYEAMAKLQAALQRQPSLTMASVLLGQIAYHEGDIDLAVRTYEGALKYKPGDADIASQLAKWKREAEAQAGFEERRYDRFRVQFEGRAEEELASQATTILTDAFWRIGGKLGTYPSDTIVAILYTEQQFKDITRAPEWSGGYYDGRIRVPVAGASRDPKLFTQVLTHELTHAMISNVAPRGVPVWLHEGLAQYFDGSDAEAAKRRVQALGGFVPLAKLEGSFTTLSAAQARVAYDESLVAVAVLFDRPGFGWMNLLDQLSGGQPFSRAIESFGFTYDDLEAPFKR
jgi:tetratricopeptide (TPR) repeat protein